MKFQQVYYVLDPQRRILWVGGEWDEFPLANGGAPVQANDVLSTLLDGHIADADTLAVMIRLISTVQSTGAALRLDYRCDSSTMLRLFQLTIQPMKESRVLLVHDLHDARTFARPMPRWRQLAEAYHGRCSICCDIRLPHGSWHAAEDLDHDCPDAVAHTVCPRCLTAVDRAIAAAEAGRIKLHRVDDPAIPRETD